MFLQRPKPYSDESLESFFIRVANKNGYDDAHYFLVATKRFLQDIDHQGYQTFPTDIEKINPCSAKTVQVPEPPHCWGKICAINI